MCDVWLRGGAYTRLTVQGYVVDSELVIELAQTSFLFFPCFLFLFRIFYTGSGPEVTTDWQPVGSGGSVAENPPLRILWTGSNWGHHRRVG